MLDADLTQELCNSIKAAYSSEQALFIHGGSSKSFYGNNKIGEPLNLANNKGVVEYEPSELFITARNGTLLSEIESILDADNQMLPFEPPHFSSSATLGGAVACGLPGPRRPYYGSIRDCILGTHIINGKGEHLKFGGKVIKNVAGYDVSRLMSGALGTLGAITQVSIKVLPKPQCEITLAIECSEQDALLKMNSWTQTQFPITATYFERDILHIRIAGLEKTTTKIHNQIGGEIIHASEEFWISVKEQQCDFFQTSQYLWRCVVPHNSPALPIQGDTCIEWNGGLRWIKTDDLDHVISACSSIRGYATLFKAQSKPKDFLSPLSPSLKNLHINLKVAFDPKRILNPGHMYSWC